MISRYKDARAFSDAMADLKKEWEELLSRYHVSVNSGDEDTDDTTAYTDDDIREDGFLIDGEEGMESDADDDEPFMSDDDEDDFYGSGDEDDDPDGMIFDFDESSDED